MYRRTSRCKEFWEMSWCTPQKDALQSGGNRPLILHAPGMQATNLPLPGYSKCSNTTGTESPVVSATPACEHTHSFQDREQQGAFIQRTSKIYWTRVAQSCCSPTKSQGKCHQRDTKSSSRHVSISEGSQENHGILRRNWGLWTGVWAAGKTISMVAGHQGYVYTAECSTVPCRDS